MLEDLNSIDMVIENEDGSVTMVIMDSGITVETGQRKALLDANLRCIASYLLDDAIFEELGKPTEVNVEVRYNHSQPTPAPELVSVTGNSGRTVEMKLFHVFTEHIGKLSNS